MVVRISDGSGDQKIKVLGYGRNKNLCNTSNAQKMLEVYFFPGTITKYS